MKGGGKNLYFNMTRVFYKFFYIKVTISKALFGFFFWNCDTFSYVCVYVLGMLTFFCMLLYMCLHTCCVCSCVRVCLLLLICMVLYMFLYTKMNKESWLGPSIILDLIYFLLYKLMHNSE